MGGNYFRSPKENLSAFYKSENHSVISYFVTPWTIQSMEFSKQEYWSG